MANTHIDIQVRELRKEVAELEKRAEDLAHQLVTKREALTAIESLGLHEVKPSK
jgi:hypothetical protein